MRPFIKIIWLMLLFPLSGIAQNGVVTISDTSFNENAQYLLARSNGWAFKQGNDTAWAKKDINISSWQKLTPSEISAKYADKNGRVEGWFRIKVKIDSSLTNSSVGVKSVGWAAVDIYIDGKPVASYGNTGINGKPFHESSPYGHTAVAINLQPGVEHTVAMHFVDYLMPIIQPLLRSQNTGTVQLVSLTGPLYNERFFKRMINQEVLYTTWVAVSTVLALLFWLLSFQNPQEKNLRLVAFTATFLTGFILFYVLSQSETGMSYNAFTIYSNCLNIFITVTIILGTLLSASIFKRKLTWFIKIVISLYFIDGVFDNYIPSVADSILGPALTSIMFCIGVYFIISAWKTLKGAQWAIVVGLSLSLIFGLISTLIIIFSGFPNVTILYLVQTGYSVPFPLSLLVYVALRFREIINEVRQNAEQVVRLSEEKKEEALNRQKVLQQEVDRQTTEIRTTLENLKTTQTQLIQSEKMASLGELTAGIAHEIQNPLNFVNNFSEVSAELVDEMNAELDKGDVAEAKAIAIDVKQNLEKIRHHGKRADFIVKGMLQHSRISTGERQETNINILADEFLKLSYQGLRAKDKSFNAEIVTLFDLGLPKVNIVSQDIGRVLLNLFNNAFYAVNQKQKTAGADYKPTVTVSTFAPPSGGLGASVKDNGNGIPDAIKDKIMQPFFTTKPTGEGTGLGLSLSYDIIVKGHGGNITINTKEGEFTEFIISLPS